jgi:hypothetical protein
VTVGTTKTFDGVWLVVSFFGRASGLAHLFFDGNLEVRSKFLIELFVPRGGRETAP